MAVLFVLGYWLSTRRWVSLGEADERKRRAMRQFHAYCAESAQAVGEVDLSNSTIVALRESGLFQTGRVVSYALTVLARTTAGQYFMFVSNTDGRPFAKVVSPDEAKRMKKGMKEVQSDA